MLQRFVWWLTSTKGSNCYRVFKIFVSFVPGQLYIWPNEENFIEVFGNLCIVAVMLSFKVCATDGFRPATFLKNLPVWRWYINEAWSVTIDLENNTSPLFDSSMLFYGSNWFCCSVLHTSFDGVCHEFIGCEELETITLNVSILATENCTFMFCILLHSCELGPKMPDGVLVYSDHQHWS